MATTATPSRRALLCVGATGLIAAGTLAAPALARTVTGQTHSEPLLQLGVEWRQALAKYEAALKEYSRASAATPDWAAGDPDLRRAPRDLGFPFYILHLQGGTGLSTVRSANQATESLVATGLPEHAEEYAKRRAEGRARVRWWVAERRRQLDAKLMSGLTAADEAVDEAAEARELIEEQIKAAVPTTIKGAMVKLRVAARLATVEAMNFEGVVSPDDLDFAQLFLLDTLADLERLSGGAA